MFKRFPQLLTGVALFALGGNAQAATGGGGLPMEAPLQKLEQSMTGPVAFAIALIAIVAAFAAIIFLGHAMGELGKTLCYVVMCIAILAAAPGFASALGIAGATIGPAPPHQAARAQPLPVHP